MSYISKNFSADNYDQLILEPEDWTEDVWQAFLDIFGLEKAERIVVSEYKVEAYGEWKEHD